MLALLFFLIAEAGTAPAPQGYEPCEVLFLHSAIPLYSTPKLKIVNGYIISRLYSPPPHYRDIHLSPPKQLKKKR